MTQNETHEPTSGSRWRGGRKRREERQARLCEAVDYVEGLEPKEVHRRAKHALRLGDRCKRASALFLSEIRERRLFAAFGFDTYVAYVKHKLGDARSTADELARVGDALRAMPALDVACAEGRFCWTIVRELAKVVTEDTAPAWVRWAEGKTSDQVIAGTKGRTKGDLPTDPTKRTLHQNRLKITGTLTAEQGAVLQYYRDACYVEGAPEVTEGTILLELVRAELERQGRPVPTTLRPANPDLDPRNYGDPVPQRERADKASAALRHEVIRRDRGRCRRCGRKAKLVVHHVYWRRFGGPTQLDNLIALCVGCHSLVHDRYLIVLGDAGALTFLGTDGEPVDSVDGAVEVVSECAALPLADATAAASGAEGSAEPVEVCERASAAADAAVAASGGIAREPSDVGALVGSLRSEGAEESAPADEALDLAQDAAAAASDDGETVERVEGCVRVDGACEVAQNAAAAASEDGETVERVEGCVRVDGTCEVAGGAATAASANGESTERVEGCVRVDGACDLAQDAAAAASDEAGSPSSVEVWAPDHVPVVVEERVRFEDVPAAVDAVWWARHARLFKAGRQGAGLRFRAGFVPTAEAFAAQQAAQQAARAAQPPASAGGGLDALVGQERVRRSLDVAVRAAKARGAQLGHVLLLGAPGLGKTSLARAVAQELGAPLEVVQAPLVEDPGLLVRQLATLRRGTVLFVDEIHRLPVRAMESLYEALSSGGVDLPVQSEWEQRSLRIELAPFTLVAATTEEGRLTWPLRSRFVHQERLAFYEPDALSEIAAQAAAERGVTFTTEAVGLVTEAARDTPRECLALVSAVCDEAEVAGVQVVDGALVQATFLRTGRAASGVTESERRYLGVLQEAGGPVGLGALGAQLSASTQSVRGVYEPFLLRRGLIARTRLGRVLTVAGARALREAG